MVTCRGCMGHVLRIEATDTPKHGSFHHECWMDHECPTCGRVCTMKGPRLAAAQERIAALEAALGWALAATDACRNELMPEWYTWAEQARAALAGSQGGGGEVGQR